MLMCLPSVESFNIFSRMIESYYLSFVVTGETGTRSDDIEKFIRDNINPSKLYKQALHKKIMMLYQALGWDEPTDATKTIERFF